MHLPKWSRPKWSTRSRPSEKPKESDDPPPYSQTESGLSVHVIGEIDEFFSSLRGTPSKTWRLELLMFPANMSEHAMPQWSARVYLSAKSLPSLMNYGLYVDKDAVIKKKGHMVLDHRCKGASPDEPPARIRLYSLANNHPRWNAEAVVAANTLSELANFKVPELGPDNIVAAVGFDKHGNRVYSYSVSRPDENFNAIYDAMPMRGWWPWPRAARKKDGFRNSLVQRFLKWKDGVQATELRAE